MFVASALCELAKTVDVIVLAQASIARVVDSLKPDQKPIPILSSPRLAVEDLAARLCGEAKPGQILIALRVAGEVEDLIEAKEVGPLALKGLAKPVPAFNVVRLKGRV